MSGTIKLACGLELKRGLVWGAEMPDAFDPLWPQEETYSAELCGGSLRLMIAGYSDRSGFDAMCGDRWSEKIATLDEAKSWLSARVVELVASLGAVIVPGDALNVAAKALHDVRQRGERDASPISKEQIRDASAVLSALGMVRR